MTDDLTQLNLKYKLMILRYQKRKEDVRVLNNKFKMLEKTMNEQISKLEREIIEYKTTNSMMKLEVERTADSRKSMRKDIEENRKEIYLVHKKYRKIVKYVSDVLDANNIIKPTMLEDIKNEVIIILSKCKGTMLTNAEISSRIISTQDEFNNSSTMATATRELLREGKIQSSYNKYNPHVPVFYV